MDIDQRNIDHLLNVIVEYVFLLSWTVKKAMIPNFVTS